MALNPMALNFQIEEGEGESLQFRWAGHTVSR
jgi:hypothetical protein